MAVGEQSVIGIRAEAFASVMRANPEVVTSIAASEQLLRTALQRARHVGHHRHAR